MDDPFSLLYSKLWDIVVDHPDIDSYVNLGNRLRLDEIGRRKLKEVVITADLPELLLLPASLTGNLHATSSSTQCVKQLSWVLTTGDMRVDQYLFPVSWVLFTALSRSMLDVMSLTWNGKKFIKRFDLISSNDGTSEAQRESSINGWSTVQTVEAEMYFTTSDLVTAATPP